MISVSQARLRARQGKAIVDRVEMVYLLCYTYIYIYICIMYHLLLEAMISFKADVYLPEAVPV